MMHARTGAGTCVQAGPDRSFPARSTDERELLLNWLRYCAALISLLGIVNHLTHVEGRWIEGHAQANHRAPRLNSLQDWSSPCPRRSLLTTDARRQPTPSSARRRRSRCHAPCKPEPTCVGSRSTLINETARHAGHADAIRELLDGTSGE